MGPKGQFDEQRADEARQSFQDCQRESHLLAVVGVVILTILAAALAAAFVPGTLVPQACVALGIITSVVLLRR